MPSPEIHYHIPEFPNYPTLHASGVVEQWAAVSRFLARCTDAPVPPPAAALKLTVERDPRARDVAATVAAAVRRASAHFGIPRCDEAGEETDYGWDLAPDALEAAVEFVAAGEPWPRAVLPPVVLNFPVPFRWRHPATGALLPRQPTPADVADC